MFLRTASKIAWRELHAAPAKFLFVVLAVAVGVAALSGVKGFGYAFKGMLLRNAKQLIAADVQAQIFRDTTPEQTKADPENCGPVWFGDARHGDHLHGRVYRTNAYRKWFRSREWIRLCIRITES